VVLDCGDGVCHCTPVYEGFSINSAVSRIDLGGRDITNHLATLLRRSGYIFHTTAELEIVKKIKEKYCYIVPMNSS
jgi:centractin